MIALRERLFKWYHAMRAHIAPSLRYSQEMYEEVLTPLVRGARWLDLGTGHRVLPNWRAEQETAMVATSRLAVGIDYDLPSLKRHRSFARCLRGDLRALPFADQSFDLATANMVLEHVEDPPALFREVRRVLAPGGQFLFHTPNALGYATLAARIVPERLKVAAAQVLENRPSADVFPTHYRANTAAQLTELAAGAGLDVVELRPIATDAVFAVVPPLAFVELLGIRLLMTESGRALRPNLIGILRRPPAG